MNRATRTSAHVAVLAAGLATVSACRVFDESLYLNASHDDSDVSEGGMNGGETAGETDGATAETDDDTGSPSSGEGSSGSDGGSDDGGDTGPVLQILGPEELQLFPNSGVSHRITLRSTDLQLQPPGGDNHPGVGHIEVLLDGELVEVLTEADGSGIAQTETFAFPTAGGIHRIEAIPRHNDGTPYPGADAHGLFWVDDGREHIAWLRPTPKTVLPIGAQNIEMEVVTLNFTLVRAAAAADPNATGEGHVHSLFNRGLPDCLPDCADFFEHMIEPPGDDRVHRLSFWHQNPLNPPSPGSYPLELLANDNKHDIYYRALAPDQPVYDVIWVDFVDP
jgi:hypothetical protein